MPCVAPSVASLGGYARAPLRSSACSYIAEAMLLRPQRHQGALAREAKGQDVRGSAAALGAQDNRQSHFRLDRCKKVFCSCGLIYRLADAAHCWASALLPTRNSDP